MKRSFLGLVIAIVLVHVPTQACDGWMFGVNIGPRFNSAGGEAFENADDLSMAMMWMFGVTSWFDICPNFRGELGLGYTQRGYGSSQTIGTMESSSTNTYNYLDLNIGTAWLPFGDDKTMTIQPYVGLYLIPGLFLNGSYTYSYGENEQSGDIESDNVQAFHFAIRPQVGADLAVSESVSVGLSIGYEAGVTNTNKSPEGSEVESPTATWNGVTTNARVLFRF